MAALGTKWGRYLMVDGTGLFVLNGAGHLLRRGFAVARESAGAA